MPRRPRTRERASNAGGDDECERAGAEQAAALMTIHPIPPGTRDVLPDEMRELRKLNLALIEVFEQFGYGEVRTPTIEYDEVMARGDGRAAGSAYRFFDERGDLLALRSDMTIPIARLAASRLAQGEPPFRLCYV